MLDDVKEERSLLGVGQLSRHCVESVVFYVRLFWDLRRTWRYQDRTKFLNSRWKDSCKFQVCYYSWIIRSTDSSVSQLVVKRCLKVGNGVQHSVTQGGPRGSLIYSQQPRSVEVPTSWQARARAWSPSKRDFLETDPAS